MSKNILIVAAVLVVAGGGYYYLNFNKTGDAMMVAPHNEAAVPAAVPSGKKMAFSEFIKQGGAYKCTVNQNVAGIETQGTTYMGGGMIRGEFSTKVQGMSVESSMIVREGYTYSWSSMMQGTGFKVKMAADAVSDTGAAASGSYSFNAQQIGDYNCEVWTVDASKFALPSDITFKEVGTH